jgi:hypothetical protein
MKRILIFVSVVVLGGCPAQDIDPPSPDGSDGEEFGGDDGYDSPDASDGSDSSDGNDAGSDEGCVDPCPFANGVTWGCSQRFMYGVNYAWHHFAGDFGGIAAWGQSGVSGEAQVYQAEIGEMKQNGVSVIRWWMFPEFWTEGLLFDTDDNPTGVTVGVIADIEKALEIAEQEDVYLMLCIFSFDNFRPTRDEFGIHMVGITPMVTDAGKRSMLLENVVRPVARAVEQSPYSHRVIAWDVINEPEWAMTGPSPYGDEDYTPNGELDAVTHAEMETFISEIIAVLRQESSALISVGAAAFKWANAWKNVDQDFHQFHMYSWVNDWWPYTNPPSHYGLDDKPLVMGEFPMDNLGGTPYSDVVSSWYSNGFAGALSWQYNEAGAQEKTNVKSFADLHPCETSY